MVVATHAQGGIDKLESRNPATGEVIGEVAVLGEQDVDAAVARARQAAEIWSELSHAQRREHLLNWRRELAARADDIADLIRKENGKPQLDALMEVFLALSHLSYAATHAEKALKRRTVSAGLLANFRARISYHPVGVVGVIGPWNYPLFTPMGSIGYALAAGNAVVFKPSELTPLVGLVFEETAAAAIPVANLVQVVTGDGRTGSALARSAVNKLAFTGSAGTGKKVMAAAAERLTPVVMELGGKDAMIVAEDADVDKAAEAAVFGALTNAGQACISVERAYVHERVYERFVERVKQELEHVRTGPEDDAHLGAITRPEQVDIIRAHLDDALAKGATAIVGGKDSISGSFVKPTVLTDLTPDMKIMKEETFGPVLPILKVRDVEEAVQKANATTFGLGSSVFGKHGAAKIADRIRAGMTSVNSVMAFASIPSLPFGGVGDSGFGRIHGEEGIREFARIKSTAEERFKLPFNALSFRQPKGAYKQMRGLITQLFGGGVIDQIGSTIRKFRT
jgi:acyl-CoA reductase-like NAD-dependent aldehyde dehydrogenase